MPEDDDGLLDNDNDTDNDNKGRIITCLPSRNFLSFSLSLARSRTRLSRTIDRRTLAELYFSSEHRQWNRTCTWQLTK